MAAIPGSSRRRPRCWLLWPVILATLALEGAEHVHAHAYLKQPTPRSSIADPGIGLPGFVNARSVANEGCGGAENADPGIQRPKTVYRPGQDVLVQWKLAVPHDVDRLDTGVRISVHYAPADSFEQNVLSGGIGEADYLKLPVAPNGADVGIFGDVVRIPEEKTCAYCTLQFVWAARAQDEFYISCADIAITKDGRFPDFDDPAIESQVGKALASGTVTDSEGNVISKHDGGLNVVGAVLGILFALLALAACGYCLWRFRKGGGTLSKPTLTLFQARSRTGASGPAPALPAGWSAAVDPASGREYYVHAPTGRTCWELPDPQALTESNAPATSAPVSNAPALPSGWTLLLDPATGQPYYVNESTGATQWERPDARI